MSYGYVYVAQISMGADFNQTVKALAEAEAYPGPSLIIAYAPCINHGIKKGMSKAQTEEELAVKCGYWHNFRFNPAAENKFTLDSKEPTDDYQAFLDGEVRYNSLKRSNPEKAAKIVCAERRTGKRQIHISEKTGYSVRKRRVIDKIKPRSLRPGFLVLVDGRESGKVHISRILEILHYFWIYIFSEIPIFEVEKCIF